MTDTMPGVSRTGAGRIVAETDTESRKVSGSSGSGSASGSAASGRSARVDWPEAGCAGAAAGPDRISVRTANTIAAGVVRGPPSKRSRCAGFMG